MSLTDLPIAVVGNGGAAAEAVLALRANGYPGGIHVFADNDHAPYNPMLGPYLVGGRITLERAFPFGDRAAFYDANRVTFHAGSAIALLDAEARQLTTGAGDRFGYERCLVATGAKPAVPPVPGLREALSTRVTEGGRRRVFTLQTLADALELKGAVDDLLGRDGGPGRDSVATPPAAGVVGASFAGVKIAATLHQLGFRVTLIERESSILPLAAHPEVARVMEAQLLRDGYELRLGAALTGVRVTPGSTGDGRSPGTVRLDFGALPGVAGPGAPGGAGCEHDESRREVDLLVVCAGNRPALSFLVPGQVESGTGILVDDQMRSSIPTLHAAGDVAQGKNLASGRHEIIGLWSSARYQGRAAGRSLAGAPAGHPGGLPHNITQVGRMLFASVGCVDGYDDVAVSRRGDAWQVRLWQEGRLIGVNLLDCCLLAGTTKHAFARAAMGMGSETETAGYLEAIWTSSNA